MTNSNIHPIQAAILKELSFKETARFSEINTNSVPNDHFTFHVKRLVEIGVVEKTEAGLYQLTNSGKEYANRLDLSSTEVILEKQAKLVVVIVGIDEVDGQKKYLMQQRLKHPFFGYYGFVGGKIKYGETVEAAAARELLEEAGVSGDLTLTGIEHLMNYDNEQSLLDEKYIFVFRAENLKGELLVEFEGGKNLWCTESEVNELPELFDDILELLEMIKTDQIEFVERKVTVKRY